MTDNDPFLWLEEFEGTAALQWVREQNARSLSLLESDPRYAEMYREALAVITAPDRIAYPSFLGDRLANFWQDEAHVRGLWRATSLASFATPEPDWQNLLDIDALAASEERNWVFHGASVLRPDYRRALVSLSDGGKDASERREFDLGTLQFVENGFFLPEGKQSAVWLDDNSLIVARDWGPGTMTKAGYPLVLKSLRRLMPLDDAVEMFRGTEDDVSVGATVLRDPDGTVRGVLINRQISFFESERYLLTPGGPVRLPVPARSSVRGFVSGQLLFSLEEDWRSDFPAGALISLDLAACLADLDAVKPALIHAPGPRESIEDVAATRNILLATVYRNVRGSAVAYRFDDGRWVPNELALPEHASLHIVDTDEREDRAFIDVAGFLTPNALWLVEPGSGAATPLKSLPARFDAAGLTVE